MELILWIVALIAFVTGSLLVFSPGFLIRAGEFFNQTYNAESIVYSKRKLFGILFVLIGVVFMWVIW